MQSFRQPITHRHLVEKNLDKAKAKYKYSSKIKIAGGGGGGREIAWIKKKNKIVLSYLKTFSHYTFSKSYST